MRNTGLFYELTACSYEQDSDSSCSANGRKFVDQLADYQLLKWTSITLSLLKFPLYMPGKRLTAAHVHVQLDTRSHGRHPARSTRAGPRPYLVPAPVPFNSCAAIVQVLLCCAWNVAGEGCLLTRGSTLQGFKQQNHLPSMLVRR
jgi:hypothetical protein